MNKKIAIIGANEFQNRLILKAKEIGYETHVFAWSSGDIGEASADYFYPINVTDLDNIYLSCKSLNIDAVCSVSSDLTNIAVNYVAERLSLTGHSINCINISTNKLLMRKKLYGHCPIPWFQNIQEAKDLTLDSANFPLIVKPIDRSGSRGVSLIHSKTELDSAIEISLSHSFTDSILVEEYIDGNEYSIESISQNGKHKVLQVTQKITSGAPNFIEIAHIAPAVLSLEEYLKIEAITINALTALDIKNGASHTEVKINFKGQLNLIEVGSRMGGDFIGSDLVPMNTGYDYLRSVLDVSLGINVDIENININQNDSYYSLALFYFSESDYLKAKSIFEIDGVRITDEGKSSCFSGVVESSADRYGYTVFKLPIKHLTRVLDIIQVKNDIV